ncbi:MAG TPA: hypothetical protein VF527_00725 [Pyrinomonadaceae bacterium]|jgi:DNA-binding CsgD family transcriptional regulator
MKSMSDESAEVLTRKLDTIIKLMVLSLIEGKNSTEAIKLLSTIGLQPKEIAELIGIPRTTVNAQVSEVRKKESRKIAGLNRGAIWVSDDFDEPLPDEFWTGTK